MFGASIRTQHDDLVAGDPPRGFFETHYEGTYRARHYQRSRFAT